MVFIISEWLGAITEHPEVFHCSYWLIHWLIDFALLTLLLLSIHSLCVLLIIHHRQFKKDQSANIKCLWTGAISPNRKTTGEIQTHNPSDTGYHYATLKHNKSLGVCVSEQSLYTLNQIITDFKNSCMYYWQGFLLPRWCTAGFNFFTWQGRLNYLYASDSHSHLNNVYLSHLDPSSQSSILSACWLTYGILRHFSTICFCHFFSGCFSFIYFFYWPGNIWVLF